MKITVNGKEREIPPGTGMMALVEEFEQSVRDDPMIINLKQTTGETHLLFIRNGDVLQRHQCESVVLLEGDDVRMVHPYFGG